MKSLAMDRWFVSACLLALPLGAAAKVAKRSPATAPVAEPAQSPLPCRGTNGTDLPILKGGQVQIDSYDAQTDTYSVYHTKFTAEGDSFVTVDGLAKASSKARRSVLAMKKTPADFVDQVYNLDEGDLPTLFPEEKAARASCRAK